MEANGGVFVPENDHLKPSTRFNVMESNTMVANNTAAFGFDVVDLHYGETVCQINFVPSCKTCLSVFQGLIHLRRDDGIHWSAIGVRQMVNMILQHYVESREIPIPTNRK